jgi:hypothetical protein
MLDRRGLGWLLVSAVSVNGPGPRARDRPRERALREPVRHEHRDVVCLAVMAFR